MTIIILYFSELRELEINKTNPVNINLPAEKAEEKKMPKIAEEASRKNSCKTPDNYGRAMLNIRTISFGSGPSCFNDYPSVKVRELTDEEFEKYKEEIREKLKTMPESVRKSLKANMLNKANIFLLDRILSDNKMAANPRLTYYLERIAESTDTLDIAEARINFLDGIREAKNLSENESLSNNSCYLLLEIKNKEAAEAGTGMLYAISHNKLFCENKDIRDNLSLIIPAEKKENADAKIRLINTVSQHEVLYKNKDIMSSIAALLQKKTSAEFFDSIEGFIRAAVQNNRLSQNGNFMGLSGFTLSYIRDAEEAEAKTKLLRTIAENEILSKNENLMRNLGNIIRNAKTKESADAKVKLLDFILQNDKFSKNESLAEKLNSVLEFTDYNEQADAKISVLDEIAKNENILNNENIADNLGDIVLSTFNKPISDVKLSIIDKVANDNDLITDNALCDNLGKIIGTVKSSQDIVKTNRLLSLVKDGQITGNQIIPLFRESLGINLNDIQRLNKTAGTETAKLLSEDDTIIAAKFIDLYKKQNINEIPHNMKRTLLKNLVASNSELFEHSEIVYKMFPMLPKNGEEYCSILPAIVRATGIETNPVEKEKVERFNSDIKNLSSSLAKLSNKEFNALDFRQEYDKNEFIADTYETVKDLSENERQKVYDYFGFELYENENATYKTREGVGLSISGYPVDLKKAEMNVNIFDKKTQEAIKQLKPFIVKFSENNIVTSGNEEIDGAVNKILDVLPELHSSIGQKQTGDQNFEAFKHSLKVMRKLSQNPEFESLNESDKKLMLIASLFHDITKKEGFEDKAHAEKSSFDGFFILKKLKLTSDEEIKLYNLIKNHERFNDLTDIKDKDVLKKKLQSIAYDLRHDNTADMSRMFAKADLSEEKTEISSEQIDNYDTTIKKYVNELQKTQPLLPVTKFPKTGDIDKAITEINEDGSTNIKGVYKDKSGLTVIKFNEVENWEEAGFPKGSTSKGLKAQREKGQKTNTGNIHFLVHGLDYPNQLAKFDAFSLVDSDVLLSVSYAECPESKYRFFRPQGVILDCDTKFIHGGGESDSGSGCEKNVEEFKRNYVFGGLGIQDRIYISDLIKETLKISDEEYVGFVQENENKSFGEIEPEETRNKLIKAFSSINSSTRKGDREYNEMYVSNTKPPMAVFAYNTDKSGKIGNPIEFLNSEKKEQFYTGIGPENDNSVSVKERTDFLQKYALEHDIPFVVFGD